MNIINFLNKHDKIIVSCVIVCWSAIVTILLGTVFDFFDSPFFRFGPSDNLYTVGTNYNINTWGRYTTVSIILASQGFVITFVGDYMYPWINSVLLNPDVKTVHTPKVQSWILANNMYFNFTYLSLFTLGAGYAQVDLFIYSNLASLIAGGIQSAIKISQKTYAPKEELPV